MKSKRIIKIGLGLCMLFAFIFSAGQVNAETTGDWTRYQNSETNNGVTNRPGPTDEAHAMLLWEVGMENPTTPPLIVDEYIYTASGNYVYCFDKNTGEQIGDPENLYGNVGDALQPMVYAEGKLFVTTNYRGTYVEAIEVGTGGTLTYCWKSSEVQLGTCASPLSYHRNKNGNGYLYTGTWNGNQDGTYFCVSAATGTVEWSLPSQNRGFYWAGAYVTDDYVAFASESGGGPKDKNGQSYLYTVNALNGIIISQVPLQGTVRNTVVYDEVNNKGYLYVGTVAGYLYRVGVATNGTLAEPTSSDFSSINLGGPIKATTIVYNNRVYVGVEGENGNPSYYKVVGCSEQGQLSLIDSVQVEIEPKGAPLLSTVEENNKLYFYYTCNIEPGGIYYFTVSPDGYIQSQPKMLFAPEHEQRCISSLALDENGTLYYKNDSNYLMAIAPKLISGLTVKPDSGSVNWIDQGFEPQVKEYQLLAGDSVNSVGFNITPVDSKVKWNCSINGVKIQDPTNVSLAGGETVVELQFTRNTITSTYTFTINKVTEDDTSLGLLYFGENSDEGKYGYNLLKPFSNDGTQFGVDLRNVTADNTDLWIQTLNSNATFEVYAVENVKQYGIELKENGFIEYVNQDKDNAYQYTIEPVDVKKDSIVRIHVISSSRKAEKDYYVTFIRTDTQKPVIPQPEPPKQPINTQLQNETNTNPSSNQSTSGELIPKPKKVSGLKSKKSKKKVTLSWKKVSGASGYQIILAKDKKFKKSKKQINISKASICKKQIKLTAKTKYVRVRAYVKKNGTTVYGAYSKILKIN